jgi:arylsulfatase A-like enzyme
VAGGLKRPGGLYIMLRCFSKRPFAVIFAPPLADVSVDCADFLATMQHKFDEVKQIGGEFDASMRQYLGDVYQIDRNVEPVLRTLDELGLRENTIVVFFSDHGPAPVILSQKGARKYSDTMVGYAGQYRGGKHDR